MPHEENFDDNNYESIDETAVNLFYPYNNINIINSVNVVIIICCKSVSKHVNADDHNLECKIL